MAAGSPTWRTEVENGIFEGIFGEGEWNLSSAALCLIEIFF